MARIEFDSSSNIITVDAEVMDRDKTDFESLRMVLDTGATYTIIPWNVAFSLGYDPAVSKRRVKLVMGGSVEYAPIITVTAFTALGESIAHFDVICHDLPEDAKVDGLVGMNFLRNFDLSVKFSEGIIELKRVVLSKYVA